MLQPSRLRCKTTGDAGVRSALEGCSCRHKQVSGETAHALNDVVQEDLRCRHEVCTGRLQLVRHLDDETCGALERLSQVSSPILPVYCTKGCGQLPPSGCQLQHPCGKKPSPCKAAVCTAIDRTIEVLAALTSGSRLWAGALQEIAKLGLQGGAQPWVWLDTPDNKQALRNAPVYCPPSQPFVRGGSAFVQPVAFHLQVCCCEAVLLLLFCWTATSLCA